ncbi:hypothetical protein FB45DRAFT_1125446 [Roridomyces roridus]|uniref:F-box domain-containing protein n=1 Tax=Roridomyces roridus TaxID=1738132 RepID=A0AAD7C850_9AGAR|nr:hypothetical protein FB45DRAFT_1125446 [Roridomyces roridus]
MADHINLTSTTLDPNDHPLLLRTTSSMSATEIQTHIDQVSLDIERQKQVLKDLERRKSALQRQLNDVRDPMAQLPLEISSEILLECGLQDPTPLMNVCKTWSEIVVSTPALWAKIRIEFPCAEGFRRRLGRWLERAGSRPLRFTLPGFIDEDIFALVRERFEQVEHLVIRHGQHTLADQRHGHVYTYTVSELLHRDPGSLPSLKTLNIAVGSSNFSSASLVRLSRSSPNLVELVLEGGELTYVPDEDIPGQGFLPELRYLGWWNEGIPGGRDAILRKITAPRLEALTLSSISANPDHTYLLSFIQRSSPPIRDLIVACPFSFGDIQASLVLLTLTLTHLEIWWPRPEVMEPLFTALLPPSPLLPNLRTLHFHIGYFHSESWEDWSRLVRNLPGHCEKRPDIRVGFFLSPTTSPAPQIRAAFKELSQSYGIGVFLTSRTGDGLRDIRPIV